MTMLGACCDRGSRAGENKQRAPSSAGGTSDRLVKGMKHGLAIDGCDVLLPAPPGGPLSIKTLGIADSSGRFDCDYICL